jgi:hypothetical protein
MACRAGASGRSISSVGERYLAIFGGSAGVGAVGAAAGIPCCWDGDGDELVMDVEKEGSNRVHDMETRSSRATRVVNVRDHFVDRERTHAVFSISSISIGEMVGGF